jgi:hypothetical protein
MGYDLLLLKLEALISATAQTRWRNNSPRTSVTQVASHSRAVLSSDADSGGDGGKLWVLVAAENHLAEGARSRRN